MTAVNWTNVRVAVTGAGGFIGSQSTLSTENFAEGVGLRADDWSRELRSAGKKKEILK